MADYIRQEPGTGRVLLWCNGQWYWYDERQQPLGRGGMGSVFIGRNYGNTDKVAIKRVHDHYADIPEIRRRARSEASLVLNHPNLVEMIGCCESATRRGPIYIISRYVNGQTIDNFIESTFSEWDQDAREKRIIELMMYVLDALEFIHRNNIVHLDIKPRNIMIECGRNVRLMDLGIAFVPRPGGATSHGANSSQSGMMGTPYYAAPEQFNSAGASVDARADIYQFGVTLFELLTGTNPFRGRTMNEVVERHRNNMLPMMSSVSRSVMDVLRKAAHPRKEDRYSTVNELRNALKQAVKTQLIKGLTHKIFR